jgi:hypothetical protein
MNTLQTVFNRMSNVHLGRSKVTVAYAEDRDSARALQQDIIDQLDDWDHVDTGQLQASVSVNKVGDEYAVKVVDYGVYVHGYDKERTGTSYLEDAANSSIIDGYSVDLVV